MTRSPSGLITLTTDFGLDDSYVGVLKGVMLALGAQLRFVDLTHAIGPQDLWAGRYHLGQAVPMFPPGTVHLAVVDPGVGGARRGVAIAYDRAGDRAGEPGWLVGPDNGLFSAVLEHYPVQAAVQLNRPAYWRRGMVGPASATFHGRDIFAPVAAQLALGVDLVELGEAVDPAGLVRLALPSWSWGEAVRGGQWG
ncbi:MAG: SAM-dependent chlorinase/fluorinase, partial [Synechococcales cyanobacterium RM1_1_8]|nr:SAM-dependent chlorinase/fluorinase [Synechococcales cyanobacterium RM1_1_8]